MTKRFSLIAFLIILFVTSNIAQNIQDEYNKLVEYVNCMYAVAYIDLKKTEIQFGDYKKDFEKYKKAFNDNVKSYPDIYKGFVKSIKQSTSIYDALEKSAKNFNKAEALWQFIDVKKKEFRPDWIKEQMIDYLILLPDDIKVSDEKINYKTLLIETSNQIKTNLAKQISNNLFDSNHEIISETSAPNEKLLKIEETKSIITENKVNEKNLGTNQEKNDQERSKFPTGILLFFALLAILLYFGFKKWGRIKKFLNSQKSKFANAKESNLSKCQKRCTELELDNGQLRKIIETNAQLLTRNKELEKQIRDLIAQKPPKTESEKGQLNTNPNPVAKAEKQVWIKASHLYADAIINGEFHRTSEQPNNDTVFELELTSPSRNASFYVYHEAHRRVIKNPDFLDGCEKQRINPQPQYLEVVKGGAAQDDFGKWKVTKKAIIKFI